MDLTNNLTYLQKVAVRGDVAYTLASASHNTEIKFRIYLILRAVKDQYRSAFLQAIKEAVTLDDEVIDALYLESQTNKVPVWLWIEEVLEDIKIHLRGSFTSLLDGTHLCMNRDVEKKKLLESAFIVFARKALLISPVASEQLFNTILEDDSLDFLHTSCFYLKSCCPNIKLIKGNKETTEEIPEEILDCYFDLKYILDFGTETAALDHTDKPKRKRILRNNTFMKEDIGGPINQLEAVVSQEELSNFLSSKITELFNEVSNSRVSDNPSKYKVIKIFPDSGISITIKTCNSKEEAENFIEKIKKEYPELLKSCEFKYYREG